MTSCSRLAVTPQILLVHGGHPGGRTERLKLAVAAGIRAVDGAVTLMERPALQCSAEELLACQGLLLGTPEHFGYMSGALKDFFDRTYYPAEGKTQGLPYALFVSAGTDGTGTVRAVERIAIGYGWRAIATPLIVVGEPTEALLQSAHDLGATMAAGLTGGIF
jgi:multimeric flavodoxin WrbA